MVIITMAFTDIDADDAKAANFHLTKISQQRINTGLIEFANVKELLIHKTQNNMLPNWIQEEARTKLCDGPIKNK